MWLWQHKNVRKRHLLWVKLLITSLALHLIILFWVFFIYQNDVYELAVTIKRGVLQSHAPVVVVPVKHVQRNNSSQSCSVSMPAARKKPTKTTMVTKNKKIPAKQANKKIMQKKQIKKPEPPKQLVAKKKEAQPNQQLQNNAIKPNTKQECATPHRHVSGAHAKGKNDPIALKVGYRDLEAMRQYTELQKKLAKYWKPPIGVSKDCECQIQIIVGWNGSIQKLEMIKQSGVLMYDIAARSALYTMSIPQWARGKSLTITFT